MQIKLINKIRDASGKIYEASCHLSFDGRIDIGHSTDISFGQIHFSIMNSNLRISQILCPCHNENMPAIIEAAVKIHQLKKCQGTIEIATQAVEPPTNSFLHALYLLSFRVSEKSDKIRRYGMSASSVEEAVCAYQQSKDDYDREELKEKLLEDELLLKTLIKDIAKKLQRKEIDLETLIDNLCFEDFFEFGCFNEMLQEIGKSEFPKQINSYAYAIPSLCLSETALQEKITKWGEFRLEQTEEERVAAVQTWYGGFRYQSFERMKANAVMTEHPLFVFFKKRAAISKMPNLPCSFVIEQLNFLLKYPSAELYRIIVDGRFHAKESGWLGYHQREKGCLVAAFKALAVAFSNLENQEVTLDLILKIYRAFAQNVELRNNDQPFEKADDDNFRNIDFSPHYGLSFNRITVDGLCELLNLIESQYYYPREEGSVILPRLMTQSILDVVLPQPDFQQAIHAQSIKSVRESYGVTDNMQLASILHTRMVSEKSAWFCMAPCGEYYVKDVLDAIDNYNKNIALADNDDTKLEVIINFVYFLEHCHAFKDANTRTFVIGLLNRLLSQQGFIVATFKDPNVFDDHSKLELKIVVKEAMELTREIISGKKEIFGFQSSEINHSHQIEYTNMIFPFEQAIKNELERLKNQQLSIFVRSSTNRFFNESTYDAQSKENPFDTASHPDRLQAKKFLDVDSVNKRIMIVHMYDADLSRNGFGKGVIRHAVAMAYTEKYNGEILVQAHRSNCLFYLSMGMIPQTLKKEKDFVSYRWGGSCLEIFKKIKDDIYLNDKKEFEKDFKKLAKMLRVAKELPPDQDITKEELLNENNQRLLLALETKTIVINIFTDEFVPMLLKILKRNATNQYSNIEELGHMPMVLSAEGKARWKNSIDKNIEFIDFKYFEHLYPYMKEEQKMELIEIMKKCLESEDLLKTNISSSAATPR